MNTKVCSNCNEEKPYSAFNKKSSRKDGLQTYCKKCNKEQLKNHYQENKKKYRKRNIKRKEKVRQFLLNIKEKNSCNRCEESHVACLEFHHLDPNEKDFNVGECVNGGYSIKKIKKEIEKCEILCANCHRKEHY